MFVLIVDFRLRVFYVILLGCLVDVIRCSLCLVVLFYWLAVELTFVCIWWHVVYVCVIAYLFYGCLAEVCYLPTLFGLVV